MTLLFYYVSCMSGTMVFHCFDRGSCLDIFSFTQFSSRRAYKFGASAIMDKSNKSQRQTCDQDMSSTFYPVASEKSMDEILGPTTQQPGKRKNKTKLPLQRTCIRTTSTVFWKDTLCHYVRVSNVTYRFAMHFICSRQYFKSINQGSDHPSFVRAAKYSTILDTKQGAV